MDIQKIVKELRDAGLKQTEIAELAGLSQGYVCDLEKGRCGKRIGYDVAKRLHELHFRFANTQTKAS